MMLWAFTSTNQEFIKGEMHSNADNPSIPEVEYTVAPESARL